MYEVFVVVVLVQYSGNFSNGGYSSGQSGGHKIHVNIIFDRNRFREGKLKILNLLCLLNKERGRKIRNNLQAKNIQKQCDKLLNLLPMLTDSRLNIDALHSFSQIKCFASQVKKNLKEVIFRYECKNSFSRSGYKGLLPDLVARGRFQVWMSSYHRFQMSASYHRKKSLA